MYRILIADDEPIERMVVAKLIKENFAGQLEIVEAASGREAVEAFERERCQIIIMDIEMPGVSGLEAAERIRRQDKDCSIIFLTAFDYFSYAKKAISVRALEYLLKPGSDEELIAVIEEAVSLAEAGERKHHSQETGADSSVTEDDEKIEHIRMSAVQELILNYIQSHYTEDISLQDAARAMNYSDAYFCRLFKQCFEKGFTAYLSEFRIEKAKKLLMDITINVKEISDQVGYRDSNYFAKVFKRVEGVTPSEYRSRVLMGRRGSMMPRTVR